MRRRGEDQQGQSLDLLLDTICNTFGGVLFISLLVVILLNMSSKEVALDPPDKPSQIELVDNRRQHQAQVRKLEKLRREVKQLEELRDELAPDELKQLVTDLAQAREVQELLLKQNSEALDKAAESQSRINDIAQKIRELQQAVARAENQLAAIELEMKTEIEKRSRNLKLPKAYRTAKREVALFLKNGRLCAYAQPDANGQLVRNAAECSEQRNQRGAFVEPIPAAGTPVDARGRDIDALSRKIKLYDRSKYYLAIFVWPDSFDHFPVVRDVMVDNEYEYRLVPFPEGEQIYVGPASSGGADVQGGG